MMQTKVYELREAAFAVIRVDQRRGVREIVRGDNLDLRDGDGKVLPGQKLVMWRDEMREWA